MQDKDEIFFKTNGAVIFDAHVSPEDRFKDWVYRFGGTKKLSIAISVHQNSVQGWIARRSRPSLDAILGILRLSCGELSLKDIDEGTKFK